MGGCEYLTDGDPDKVCELAGAVRVTALRRCDGVHPGCEGAPDCLRDPSPSWLSCEGHTGMTVDNVIDGYGLPITLEEA